MTIFEQRGYKIIETLRDNRRYKAYKLESDGKHFFGKQCVDDRAYELENDVWFNLVVTRLTLANPEMRVRVPKIIEFGNDWLINEFWEYDLIADPRTCVTGACVEPYISDVLEVLRELNISVNFPEYSFHGVSSFESALYLGLARKVDLWSEKPLERKLMKNSEVERAKEIIKKYTEFVKPALQHGDFVPWHMYALPDHKIGLIDAEKASIYKPQYYDLAYCFSRFYTRCHASEQASNLLSGFIDGNVTDREKFEKAFLPVITLRAVGMMVDAVHDEDWNDYHVEARELLEKCFNESLTDLM